MSIYRKHICHIYLLDRPDKKPVEFMPFHINMLNCLEETTGRKYTEGELIEHTPRHWEFTYKNAEGAPRKISIVGTDEDFSDKYKEEKPSEFKTVPGPKFK